MAIFMLCHVVVVVVKVMFAHSYSKNSHERAKEESYALLKSSVLSRQRDAVTDSWSSLNDANSEFHVAGPATAKLRGP